MGPTGFMGRSLLALQNQSSFQKCLLTKLCKGYLNSIFALFYFVFEGKFQVQAPRGAYMRRGDLTEGFLRYHSKGLIFGGYMEGLIFGILRYYGLQLFKCLKVVCNRAV